MVLVKYRDIPLFLHGSSFYESLCDDNEEIEVLSDCYRENDTVDNAQELEELLRVLRFWGVDAIPLTLITYCFNTPCDDWYPVAREFENELRYISTLNMICSAPVSDQLQLAVRSGRLELVKHTFEMFDQPILQNSCGERINIYEDAAGAGHLHILQYFFECGISVTTEPTDAPAEARTSRISRTQCAVLWDRCNHQTCVFAARGGHLSCLQYLCEHGCVGSMYVTIAAAQGGHLDCLRYAHEQGHGPMDSSITYWAAMGGHLLCLQYTVEHGGTVSQDTIERCAEAGGLDCIKYLHSRGYKLNSKMIINATKKDYLPVVVYLHDNDVPWHVDVAKTATASGSVHCLRYAMQHHCPLPSNILSVAASSGNIDCVDCLARAGHKVTNMVMEKAYASGRTECLQHLQELSIQASIDANNDRLEDIKVLVCVKNAHKYGFVWSARIMSQLETLGYVKCIEFAVDRGYKVQKKRSNSTTVFNLLKS